MRPTDPIYRNRLPHLTPAGGVFFITFRLHDSLPQAVNRKLYQEPEQKLSTLKEQGPTDLSQKVEIAQKRSFAKFDQALDHKPFGECWLKREEVAKVVVERLWEYHDRWYSLQAYCIMPNHVHILIDTSSGQVFQKLSVIMQRIKGGTAREINQRLNRKGVFWQKDSYDHLVRNQEEWLKIYAYILNNPVKAGLVNDIQHWPYSYGCNEFLAE
ncbi:MAG: transposase [Bacteroidota bacterium]